MDPWTAAIGAIAYQFSANILNIIEYVILLLIPRIRPYKITKCVEREFRNPEYDKFAKVLTKGKYLGMRNGEPYGIVLAKWYIAYVCSEGATIYCTHNQYQKLIDNCEKDDSIRMAKMHTRDGRRCCSFWCRVGIKNITLTKSQKQAIDYIVANMTNINVFWIHGPPGCGKTTISSYLAKLLGMKIICGLDPFQDQFDEGQNTIYTYDEVDGLLKNALKPTQKADKEFKDKDPKNVWCTALDLFKMQSKTLFIMTSNMHPRDIEGCTDAFWRPGRVALIELTKPINNAKEMLKPAKF